MILSSDMLYSQLSEANYRIYSVKSRKEVSISEIVEDAENYDVIFFGEEHNDSVAHYLQHSLLSTLHKKFASNLTLSLEMFDRDVQTIMNEYLLGLIRKRNFIKDARVWSNYKDYEPLVEFAKDNKLDVVCANAPGRYTNLAGREGQEALMRLSSASPFDSSAKKMPPMGGFNLVLGQSLWDATMAYSISQYLKKNKGKKVLQVNGRFHSDEGFAIVTQLRKYCPKYRSLIISTGSDDSFPAIEWGRFSHLGDYVIITDPAIPKTF